jgi:hypothetical protein
MRARRMTAEPFDLDVDGIRGSHDRAGPDGK